MELNEPQILGNELKYLRDCIKNNELTQGKFIGKFELYIKELHDLKFAVSTNNCTSALHIALKLTGANKDTEVIAPSITFVSSINAILYNNSNPVFMDVDENLNIDISKTINFIKNYSYFKNGFSYNKKTNKQIVSIIIVHVFGNPVIMDELHSLCKERNIKIVEDAAESLGSKYIKGKFKNRYTGTIGDIGCISFNGNKVITSAGGGMIITNNKRYEQKARYLINQSKDDALKFKHNELGYNYRQSNLHSAIGLAQIENLDKILIQKNNIYNQYNKIFTKCEGLTLINNHKNTFSNKWINVIKINQKITKRSAKFYMKKLLKKNINARFVWFPNNLQKYLHTFQSHDISNLEMITSNCICLPSSSNLKFKDIKKVCSVFCE